MDFTNIPTGLKITSQIPLNVKEFCKDEDTLAYLGVDDNLAFTYHDQLEVLCLAEKSIYIWREVQVGEENTGLVAVDFTYPNNHIVYGIDYSNRVFNFFKNISTEIEINNIGSGSQIYKDSTIINDVTEFNLRTLVSTNNSILINQTTTTLDLSVNTTWLQQWLIDNSSVICNIFSSCELNTKLAANDDILPLPFLPGVMTIVNVLDNDNLGTGPTTITSLDTSGLSPLVANAEISLDGLSIELTMGSIFKPGATYSFDYTITDSTSATSTATVFFQDIS